MEILDKCLLIASAVNSGILLLDDTPVETTWKKTQFQRINPKIFKFIYDFNHNLVMPMSVLTGGSILASMLLGTTGPTTDLSTLQNVAINETAAAKSLSRRDKPSSVDQIVFLVKLFIELVQDLGFEALHVIWPIIKDGLKSMMGKILALATKLIRQFTKSDNPWRRQGLATQCLLAAMQCRKFVWRVRGCIQEYFATDEKASLRDSLEFKMPNRLYFWLWMKVYSWIYDPQFYGLERLGNFLALKHGKPLTTPKGITYTGWADTPIMRGLTADEEKHPHTRGNQVVATTNSTVETLHTAEITKHALPIPRNFPILDASGNIEPKARRPLLFVGNHTLLAADMCVLQWYLSETYHVYLRGIAHRGHFNFPGWSHFMRLLGAVSGTREACKALLDDGWSLLIYPGGGREVMKKAGDDQYKLMWGTRTGFARVAIDNNAIIIPVASVGCNETFPIAADIPFDAIYGKYKREEPVDTLTAQEEEEVQEQLLEGIPSLTSKAKKWQSPYTETFHQALDSKKANTPETPVSKTDPKVDLRVSVPLVIPTPNYWQRWYFEIGEPIDAAQFSNMKNADLASRFLRDKIKDSLELSIRELKRVQANDEKRYTLSRWGQSILSMFK